MSGASAPLPELVDFGPWRIACDAGATRGAYATIDSGGPEACSCNGCRNWIALRGELYTPALRKLLGALGIIPEKETEVYHTAPLGNGLHLYGGWWHLVGRIDSDSDGWWRPPGAGLDLMLLEKNALAAPAFLTRPVLQLEFQAEVRWALDEPEPEA